MSYLDLLNIKYYYKKLYPLLIIFIISILIYILNLKMYDSVDSLGYIENGLMVARISNPDAINNLEYIVVEKNKYKVSVEKVNEFNIDKDNLIGYQDVVLKVNGNFKDNQVLTIKVLYNEEKVWKKIKNKVF